MTTTDRQDRQDRQEPVVSATATDRALRRSLTPDEATVQRVVGRALAPPTPQHRRWRVWVPLAAATLFLLLLATIPLWQTLEPESPSPQAAARPATAPAAPHTAVLTISNADGFVTITAADGSKTIMLSGGTS